MGPPKAKPHRLTHDQRLRRYDYFEYRTNVTDGSQYMFNPYTGETIFGTDTNYMDRQKSVWAPIDRHPRPALHVIMYPEFYQSRIWGRRAYHGWTTNCLCMSLEEQLQGAATHIAAVYRGWRARQELRKYYRERYNKRLDAFSGYYYYYDSFNQDLGVDSSWYKPRLAFPDDIQVYNPPDPDDYLQGCKYSFMSVEHGPYCKREGIRRGGIVRSKHIAFLKPNEWRDSAFTGPEQIDLEVSPLGSIVAFMDELNAINYKITDYALARTAIHNGNWKKVLHYMHLHSDRVFLQIYGLLSFAKTVVPTDQKTGILEVESKEVLDLCIFLIDDPNRDTPPTQQVFALMALHNILCMRAGRMEFFSTEHVVVQGARRQDAIADFMSTRIKLFLRLLDGIEMESNSWSSVEGGRKVVHTQSNPSRRGVDLAEYAMLCLGLLAQNPEHKELLATKCVGSIMRCMMKCTSESGIAAYGLRALYNFCYRCESGQMEVIDTDGAADKLIDMVHACFQGDADCMKNCRRFELAIKPGVGWRGNVEDIIEREMKAQSDRFRPTQRKIYATIAEQKHDDFEGLGDFENENKLFLGDDKQIGDGDDEEPGNDYREQKHMIKDKADSKARDSGSIADSKGSYQAKAQHNYKSKAREMRLDDDDDDVSVNSELTL